MSRRYPFVLVRPPLAFLLTMAVVGVAASIGCTNEDDLVRDIQIDRQRRLNQQTTQDDLGEAFSYLNRLVELNGEQANRQIVFHLNRWLEDRGKPIEAKSLPEIFGTLPSSINREMLVKRFARPVFAASDVGTLRDQFLLHQMVDWIDDPIRDDPLLEPWFESLSDSMEERQVRELQTASRLFDWTIRNITYRPRKVGSPIPPPDLPSGLTYQGAGYRQTLFQSLMRGAGDGLQRMNVFLGLCRQAGIEAFVIAINPREAGQPATPWTVGVLVGGETYLFECEVGVFIPATGDQGGIATLKQARRDAQVLRRMNVPGFFDYPYSKSDIQSCVALLPLKPEVASERFAQLQGSLTGRRRMVASIDLASSVAAIDDASGISGVRLWELPLRAEQYEAAMERAADRDSRVAQVHRSQWLMLDGDVPASQALSLGRWRHLTGRFDDDLDADVTGARTHFLEQRQPEFEIADLRTDVSLQKKYDVRRQLGMPNQQYDFMIEVVQTLIRSGKRTSTYWLSLIQYEDGRYDNAEKWIEKRVLDPNQEFVWGQAAQYNLARTAEKQGDLARAIELHKTQGLPTEHGSRLRARLLARQIESPKAE